VNASDVELPGECNLANAGIRKKRRTGWRMSQLPFAINGVDAILFT